MVVTAACFMFGNMYFFDQTSATEQEILSATGMSEQMFGVMSAVYSWPNVIIPLFGGVLIDLAGVRLAVLFFTTLVLLGSVLFTLGLWWNSVPTLIVARTLYGVGGESQNVANLTLCSKWFRGRELSFAMAVTIAVSRLGSVAALDSQPVLVKSMGLVSASGVTSGLCFLSLCCALVATQVDRLADRRDAARGLPPAVCQGDGAARLRDLCKLGALFWLVSLSLVTVSVAVFPFIQVVSQPYLKERFDYGNKAADEIASLINLVSAVLAPFLGLSVDKFGCRPLFLVASSAALCACHIVFLTFPHCYHCAGVLPLYLLMGAGFGIYGAVIWPCIPLVVDGETVGTALGISTSLQNVGLAISAMILTALHSASGEWLLPFLYMVGCCAIGAVSGIAIWILDLRKDKALTLASADTQ